MGYVRALLSLCFLSISIIGFSQTVQLHTSGTIIFLRAGPDAPQLLSLQVPGQTPWQNRAPESLIKSVEVDGKDVPIQWQLDRNATRSDGQNASFVYDS